MFRFLITAGLSLGITSAAHAQIVVNEFLADPVGPDTGLEWMELVNVSDVPVDLIGWEIQRATTFWSIRYIFPYSVVLAPGEHWVVGEPGVLFADETVPALSLGNALSTGDGIRICNALGQIKDVVIYGPNNTDNLLDDSGAVATSLGPAPVEGLTIARIPSATDTDLSADDWQVVLNATPGTINLSDPQDTATAETADTASPTDTMDSATVTETADTATAIIETADTATAIIETADTATAIIETADTATAGIETADTATPDTDTADTARSRDTAPPSPFDTSDSAATHGTADTGIAGETGDTATATLGATGDTHAPGDTATADTFTARHTADTASPVPDETADTAPPQDTGHTGSDDTADSPTIPLDTSVPVDTGVLATCTDASFAVGLVINEVLTEPAGIDPGHQWMELFNRSGYDLDLSGWTVWTGEETFDRYETLPEGTFLPDGDYLVLGGQAARYATVTLAGLWLGDGEDSDAVQIRDCHSTPVDTVIYGPDNAHQWTDDLDEVPTSVGPVAPVGSTIGRRPDGSDTQDSSVDVVVLDLPTPGSSNDFPPVLCGGPDSGVVVNEIFRGEDGTSAWVELLHTGTLPVALDGWTLEIGRTEWSAEYTFSAGENLLPGGRIVVGDPYVSEVGYPAALSIGNGTRGDTVRLVDCRGFPTDSVVYGPENPDGWPGDDGTVAQALAPSLNDDQSLSRLPDGADQDDSSLDLSLAYPTPGRANTDGPLDRSSDSGGLYTDVSVVPVCGCNSTGPASTFWALVALVCLRRRR
jgi:hypothetical protein